MADSPVNPPLRAVLEQNGTLVARQADGRLVDAAGQLYFEFAEGAPAPARSTTTADQWFAVAYSRHEAGQLEEAVEAYRHALRAGGPNAALCFHLGNALFALDQKESAAERFQQAVELDPLYAEAWNNLGIVFADTGQLPRAVAAFASAVRANPTYADAHYNLADLLDEQGQVEKARTHWQTYLRLDSHGIWADHARRRLGETEG
jgi:tetratricopeptide (TPR) repeat protein